MNTATLNAYRLIYDQVGAYISANLEIDELKLDDYCVIHGVSRRQVQRALKYRGTTWRSMLTSRRVRHGATLLRETRHSVKDIARRVGYRDPASFSEAFRIQYGQLPHAYRSYREVHDART